MRHLGHTTGTLPGGGSSALRLCSSPTCANNIVSSELANGTVGNNSQASTMQHHTYSSIGAPTYHSLRRSARSSRSARAPASSSPSPPPPPPPRYPGQYPTLPANGSVCHHYNSSRYNNGSAEGCREQQQQQQQQSAGTTGRESRSKSSSRRMEQLSASSHQQRQEELQVHRGGYHA
ncbi:myb-like protein I [Trichogramma pretiosum]|uniref:myb-like protein I n=1 Tax=Trichogramma pretiosum TaxID=7493 RepID=UPI0006C9928B|nr:myb-like protein I [Trichogramma pretiosum]